MRLLHRSPVRTVAVAVAAVAAALVATLLAPAAGHAATAPPRPAVPGSIYLALGDSIVFGYRESTNLPTPDYSNAASFRGYPEQVASALGLKLTNAACPGETTASFIARSGASNGCENTYVPGTGQVVGGYRVDHPLHVSYARSQLAFAKTFLRHHPGTRLVTLTIGANDAFLCQASTSDGCVNEFGTVLAHLKTNLATIVGGIRGIGYTGQFILLTYYSLDYADATLTGEVNLLDKALVSAVSPYHVRIASGYNAFAAAAAQTRGDVCAAALVTVLTSGSPCGVHPSIAGTSVLAQAVEGKVRK